MARRLRRTRSRTPPHLALVCAASGQSNHTALPKAWPEGEIKGLRARGAVGVDVRWAAGKATLVVLRPDVDGEQKLRPPRGQKIAAVSENGKKLPLSAIADGVVRLKMMAGKE